MKSRLLVGVGAWLLGVAAATTGSMIAVNQIAHGLLGPQPQQLTGAAIGGADDKAGRASPSAAASSGRPSPSSAARPDRDASRTRKVAPSASATSSPHQTGAGKLLQSAYGNVTAECQPGGAYLLYWSAAQGYQADDVFRGPAATATVNFENLANHNDVVMQVSCKSGSPVARLTPDH